MSLDVRRIAANLRVLADAFEEGFESTGQPVAAVPPAALPAPRGRGRPVKGEAAPVAPVAAPAVPAAEADPFAEAAPAAPTATIEQVRKALTDLKNATSQDNALKVLKDAGGADNLPSLKPEKYGAVVKAATAAIPGKPAPVVEEDPFAIPAAAAEKPLTLEDVKVAALDAQKRAGIDRAKAVVMEHGGKKPNPDGSGEQVSFTSLPESAFKATIKALNAVPTTK